MARGTLRKRSNGRSWTVQIYAGRDQGTGKKVYKAETVKGTKADAERRLRELLKEVETVGVKPTVRVTVGQYLDAWLDGDAESKTRVRTLEEYRGVVKRYLKPMLGGVRLDRLTGADVRQAEGVLLRGGGAGGRPLSGKTVMQAHRVLSSALTDAGANGLLSVNVAKTVSPPRAGRYEASTLSWSDVGRLVDSLEEGDFRSVVVLAVLTGLRRSELAGLRWKDVDFEGMSLSVRRALVKDKAQRLHVTPPKSGRSRVVALSTEGVEELRSMRRRSSGGSGEGFLFCGEGGGPVNAEAWSRMFRRCCRRLGFEGMRFHDLRHTHASLLLAGGVHLKVVSERLGHSSIGITGDLYSHVAPTVQRGAAELFGTSWRSVVDKGDGPIESSKGV